MTPTNEPISVVETGLSPGGYRLAATLPLPKEDPR